MAIRQKVILPPLITPNDDRERYGFQDLWKAYFTLLIVPRIIWERSRLKILDRKQTVVCKTGQTEIYYAKVAQTELPQEVIYGQWML